jgi:hypothetical protein
MPLGSRVAGISNFSSFPGAPFPFEPFGIIISADVEDDFKVLCAPPFSCAPFWSMSFAEGEVELNVPVIKKPFFYFII